METIKMKINGIEVEVPAGSTILEAAEIAGISRKVMKESPNVGFTEHRLADGRTAVVAVNYDPVPVACPVKISGTVERIWNGELKDGVLKLAANDTAVFVVR